MKVGKKIVISEVERKRSEKTFRNPLYHLFDFLKTLSDIDRLINTEEMTN